MATPVTLVNNGTPVVATQNATPVTIVDANGKPAPLVPPGGVVVQDGDAMTVKAANDVSPTEQGTVHVDGNTATVELPVTVAMVEANATVGLQLANGSDAGNGTAFVNQGYLTAVRLPEGNGLVSDGDTKPLSKADNTGLLAMVTAHVDELNQFESVALPHNYAVIQDGIGNFDVQQYDSSAGFAVIARVTNNAPSVQLSNATTRVVVNAQPATVKNADGSVTVSGTIGVDQGALTGITLPATHALVPDGHTVPATGTGSTATVTVANGVVTGVTLS